MPKKDRRGPKSQKKLCKSNSSELFLFPSLVQPNIHQVIIFMKMCSTYISSCQHEDMRFTNPIVVIFVFVIICDIHIRNI